MTTIFENYIRIEYYFGNSKIGNIFNSCHVGQPFSVNQIKVTLIKSRHQ